MCGPERYEQAAAWWKREQGRLLPRAVFAQALGRVQPLLLRVQGREPVQVAREQGMSVVITDEPFRFGPLRLWARLVDGQCRIPSGALEELSTSFPDPLPALVAHELFHLLDPDCPLRLAELSAHLLVTLWLDLPDFAGLAGRPARSGLRSA